MSEVPKVTAKAAEEVLPSVGLTYEGWLKAKEILLGNNPKAVSMKAAAKAAGVTPRELRLWARRAREGDPTLGDALTWAHEIPAVLDAALESQGQVMEDLIWQRAVNGTEKPVIHKGKVTDTFVEYDHRREQAILKRRDPAYSDSVQDEKPPEDVDLRELFNAFERARAVDAARKAYVQSSIEHGLPLPDQVIEEEAKEVKPEPEPEPEPDLEPAGSRRGEIDTSITGL